MPTPIKEVKGVLSFDDPLSGQVQAEQENHERDQILDSIKEAEKETGKKMVLPATTKSENVNYSKSYDSIEKVT